MTADGLAGELPTGVILALCDKLLGEVGRRSHRFAWLRAPGEVADSWLPVEAYYPRHRLVVICHAEPTPYDHLFGELVPQHGLRLLQFDPADLGDDPTVAHQTIARMIMDLPVPNPAEPPAPERRSAPRLPSVSLPRRGTTRQRDAPAQREAPPRTQRQAAQPAQREAPRRAPRRAPQRPDHTRGSGPRGRPAVPPRRDTVAVGVVAGVVLAAVCGAELVVAVIVVMLGAGRVVLGLGIAFDAGVRALGTLDSIRVGKTGRAWACAIVGSPAVLAAAASWPRPRRPGRLSGPGYASTEAAPLAGLLAVLALVCIVIGLLS